MQDGDRVELSEGEGSGAEEAPPGTSRALLWIGLFAAYLVVGLILFRPVQEVGYLSDDITVLAVNPYVKELSAANLVAVFDPRSPAIAYALNYSPVHVLFHAFQIHWFGESPTVFHLSNALLHAGATLLLVMLFVASRVPLPAAAAMGAVFLVHPANVEAVAFIFQAKTLLSTVLAFGSILLFRRLPALAALIFALAMLTKFSAVFALPMVAVLAWARHRDEPSRRVVVWLLVWVAVLVAVAVPEFHAFQRMGQHVEPLGADLPERVRTIVAIAMRYLVMAASGMGVSAFHQTRAAGSWLDPWWLTGLAALGLLAWRLVVTLRRRDEEAAWWVLAVASFAPICQIFPFIYPMADRYLYTILPGLMGGALLAGMEFAGRVESRLPAVRDFAGGRAWSPLGAAALLLVATIPFSVASHERVLLFRTDTQLAWESADNYPDGIQAALRRANEAGQRGDAAAAAEALDEARRQGFSAYSVMAASPFLARVVGDARVREVLEHMASYWVDRLEPIEEPFQIELINLGASLTFRGEPTRAIEVLERARDIEGPYDEIIRKLLQEARLERVRQGANAPRRAR